MIKLKIEHKFREDEKQKEITKRNQKQTELQFVHWM